MGMIRATALLVLALLTACTPPGVATDESAAASSPSSVASSAARQRDTVESVPSIHEPCLDHDPLRNAYFGELHVHTSYSMDAFAFDTRTTPDDAYRFARGEPLELTDGRVARLERPLDFTAVTDHASGMGELRLCTDPASTAYDSAPCESFRGKGIPSDSPLGEMGARVSAIMNLGAGDRIAELCGEDLELCRAAMDSVWADHQRAAERFQDRSSACRFTTFNGYEYTATPNFAKVHRNVIFRNEHVPSRVVAWADEPSRWELWRKLDEQCLQADNGCDVLTIPHNSNMSNGQMFEIDYRDESIDVQRERAALWQKLEPLVEIMQTKGDSECRNGLWQVLGGPDPQCDFEKWRPLAPAPEACRGRTDSGGMFGAGCQSRLDFVRYALVEGLREEARLGVNPIKLGHTASTDMHNANPGDVAEASFDGVLGKTDQSAQQRLAATGRNLAPASFNPGGLVGVWAEENSRDALFDAMKRRETFGTTGTRIQPRFFGGWSYPTNLCDRADLLRAAYAGGVSMGGDLPPRPREAQAPAFLVSALRDPGTPEVPTQPLQRIQIIKAWPGEGDAMHQAVFDVAGGENGARVDPLTCETHGPGSGSLCAIWRDPDFDPNRGAVYYARVLENPSCRWSRLQCNALPEAGRPAACGDPRVPSSIQERAWTSPIWYAPEVRREG